MPLFSIIVPVYNASLFLDRCIQSIVSQSFPNFELLLVDDGSTDGSYSICLQWADQDTRIQVFHQDNNGASSARNVGIQYARGKYLQFVDSDDTLESDCLETLAGLVLKYNEPDLVEFKLNYLGPSGIRNVQGTTLQDGIYDRNYIEDAFLPVMLQIYREDTLHYNIFNVLRVIKREIIIQHGIRFDESIRRWEDWLFALEVFNQVQNMLVTTLPLYNYFGHEGGGLGGRYNSDTYKFLSTTYITLDRLFADRYNTLSEYSIKCRVDQYERCVHEIFQYETGKKRQLILEEMMQDPCFNKLILSSSQRKGIFIVRPCLTLPSKRCAVRVLTCYIHLLDIWRKMKAMLRKLYYCTRKGAKQT